MLRHHSRLLIATAAWLVLGLSSVADAALATWGFHADWLIAINGDNDIDGEIVFETGPGFTPGAECNPEIGAGIVSMTFQSGGFTWTQDHCTTPLSLTIVPGADGGCPPTFSLFSLTFVNGAGAVLTIDGLINGLLAVEVLDLLPLPISTTSINGEFFLTSAVPEPSSLMFGGIFIAGACAKLRRRMQKSTEAAPGTETPTPAV